MKASAGLHHITAIATDAKRNFDFYTEVLGLRLVKKTVNFDDPGTYHLYFANETGTPGTVLTFFPWGAAMKAGRRGTGQAGEVQYKVPKGSLPWWQARLDKLNVHHGKITERIQENYLALEDPDGMKIELIDAAEGPDYTPWTQGSVGEAHAIHGFYGISLLVNKAEETERVMQRVLGYQMVEKAGNRIRYRSTDAQGKATGDVVDILAMGELGRGWVAAGSVHHVAFRAETDAHEMEMRAGAEGLNLSPTPQIDRNYFHSVYFREPNGVLFEIATDAPGFLIDEPKETLGKKLMLPQWYETRRAELENALPKLN